MPFTQQEFFQVFARYNQAVWPAQAVLYVLAVAAVVLTLWGARYSRYVAAISAFLWAWMALAYHAAFFRQINPAALVFAAVFLVQAGLFVWYGVVRARIAFTSSGLRPRFGTALIIYALVVYPALGDLSGQHYPAMPTFGLPCPTTIFTIGLLLLAGRAVPWGLFVIPVLWSLVGTQAALALGVPEDFGLPVAGLIALVSILPARMPHALRGQRRAI